MSTYGERLIKAREHAGLNQSELARRAGVKPQSVQHLEDPNKAATGSKHTGEFARICGVREEWLSRERGEMLDAGHLTMQSARSPYGETDFLTIERYNVQASAGAGEEPPDQEKVIGNMRIARSWLTGRIGRYTAEHNLKVISAMGDSMVPTFNDGDILMVDTGVKVVDRDGIFVLRAHDRLYVKRVRQRISTGTYEVSSDNPTAGVPEELSGTEQIDVLGKVVGAWNWRIM